MSESNIEKIDLEKVDWQSSRNFFEGLGEELDKLDDKNEAYDFTWVGKRKAIIEAGAPINKTLRPNVDSSKNWDASENLFIEGDNLDALKLLQESYLGKVKMIYIDPPYNTGKDFVYHDNFKANVEDYDEATEYKDEEGNIQFKKNEKSNGRYHSDWLNMMYPRLKLARNLLTDDGVIFISIDDNEQSNLRKLCDEIFGEDEFIATFIWQKNYSPKNNNKFVSDDHDFIICFAKNKLSLDKLNRLPRNDKSDKFYDKDDGDGKGLYGLDNLTVPGGKQQYILEWNGKKYRAASTRGWAYNEEKMKQLITDGRIYFPEAQDSRPRYKRYLSEAPGLISKTILPYELVGHTDGSKKALDKLVGENIFDFPKPVELVKYFGILATDDKSLVVDFFSGSGTTAHAVMQLNAEDGGSRKWIMVQLPEETDEKSEAFKAGYKTIPHIARERIRLAGDKIAKEHPDAKVDYGFRALTIADTNYKDVQKPAGEYRQDTLLDSVDNIKEDRSDLDLLYGVLTQSAFELNKPIEKRNINGSDVYLYDYFGEVSGLIACFAENVSEDTIKELAKLKPLTVVLRDSSFKDSQAKINLSEHFRVLSPETKIKVV